MASAISALSNSVSEEYDYTSIQYSSETSDILNLSSYVSDYKNIRFIVWCGPGQSIICIYDYNQYLKNVENNVKDPHRIIVYSKYNSNAMGSQGENSSTKYYYFKTDEMNQNGDLSIYYTYDGGTNVTQMSYTRYSKCVYLVSAKEGQ